MNVFSRYDIPLKEDCVNNVFSIKVKLGARLVCASIDAQIPYFTFIEDESQELYSERNYIYLSIDEVINYDVFYCDKYAHPVNQLNQFVFEYYNK